MAGIPKRERFFALTMALVFIVSASALTIAVIYDAIANKDAATTQPPISQVDDCDIRVPQSAATEALPDDYQAKNADVTELQVEDVQVGTGAAAKNGDCLVMKYHGTLAKDGTKFDGNFDTETALQFTLGKGDVIPGWDQGLEGMKVGGLRRLVIPYDLAYGEAGSGEVIPPKSNLVFLVKLVRIK